MKADETTAGSHRKREPYLCLLLRCRLDEGRGPPAWRFTVQQVGRGAPRRSFARFSDLVAYVEAELGSCEASARSDESASVHSEVEP